MNSDFEDCEVISRNTCTKCETKRKTDRRKVLRDLSDHNEEPKHSQHWIIHNYKTSSTGRWQQLSN